MQAAVVATRLEPAASWFQPIGVIEDVYNAEMDSEDWQLAEIETGIEDLDNGRTVAATEVVTWLRSWGEPTESKAPE